MSNLLNGKRKPSMPRKHKYKLLGGPFDGITVWFSHFGTLEFKLGKFKGYYDNNFSWVEIPEFTTK